MHLANTVGPNNPSASSQTTTGKPSWSNLSNAYSSNNSYATVFLGGTGDTEDARYTGFSFSLGGGVTSIDGITVEIERNTTDSFGTKAVDSRVYLTKNGTATVGSNKADATAWPTSDTYATYGGASDLWGTTWSQAEIESANFGLILAAKGNGAFSPTASVDHVRITVDHTASGVQYKQYRSLMGVGI
jgi:hypothetical protein